MNGMALNSNTRDGLRAAQTEWSVLYPDVARLVVGRQRQPLRGEGCRRSPQMVQRGIFVSVYVL